MMTTDGEIEVMARTLAMAFPLEDWKSNSHLMRTPERFLKGMRELTTPEEFKFTTFNNANHVDEIVIVGPVSFTSLCAHHLMPFFGKAFIGYIPNSKLAGLSKFARLVKETSKGLWVQEELNQFIAEVLHQRLQPVGAGVVMRAEHMCMTIRGVKEPGALTTTSVMKGAFLDHEKQARAEFMSLIAKDL